MLPDYIRQILNISLTVLVLFITTGCNPAPEPAITSKQNLMGYDLKKENIQVTTVGYSIENRPIRLHKFGNGPLKTLVIGAIHGNEPASAVLANKLITYLRANPDYVQGKTVLIIPVANPDGLEKNTRHNINNIDLNRNFPAPNRENNEINGMKGLTEPESITLFKVIAEHSPDQIISIHQPLNCVDYDGPAKDLASRMANKSPLPLKKLGSRPGSLGSYAGLTKNTPIVTVELLKIDTELPSDMIWKKYGKMMLEGLN